MPRKLESFTVTVVIPTFNDGQLLKDAVASAAASSYPIQEIIVVDDGSTSESARIVVEELAQEIAVSLKFIRKENGGAASARNTGIFAASGDWIAFLDADDTMLEDSIESKISLLRTVKAKEQVAGIYGSFIWSDTLVTQRFQTHLFAAARDDVGILGKVPGGAPSYLLKKDALVEVCVFDESLRYNEDFDLLLRLIDMGYRIVGNCDPGFVRNVTSNSLTRKNVARSLKGGRIFLRKAWRKNLLGKLEIVKRFAVNYARSLKLAIIDFRRKLSSR